MEDTVEDTVEDMVGEKAESMADMVGDDAQSCGATLDGIDVCCGGNKANKRVDFCTDIKKNCGKYWSQVDDDGKAAIPGQCYVCQQGLEDCFASSTSTCVHCEVCYDPNCYAADASCAIGLDTCPLNDKGGKRSKKSCKKRSECTWGVPCYYDSSGCTSDYSGTSSEV